MNVALELRRPDSEPKLIVKVLDESVDEVVRGLVGLMYQRILTLDNPNLRIRLVQRRQIWIVLPKGRRRCAHVRQKPIRITTMKVPDCGRQHDDVTGGLKIL